MYEFFRSCLPLYDVHYRKILFNVKFFSIKNKKFLNRSPQMEFYIDANTNKGAIQKVFKKHV